MIVTQEGLPVKIIVLNTAVIIFTWALFIFWGLIPYIGERNAHRTFDLLFWFIIVFVVTLFSIGRILSRRKHSYSRFDEDVKGDFKGSPPPYGAGTRAAGGKSFGEND